MICSLDFETRSCADLRKVGVHVYAADPSTEVLCAAYAFDDGPVTLWHPKLPPPTDLLKHIRQGGEVRAWNLAFERAIVNGVCVRLYDWPELHLEQSTCTMVQSYAMALPGSLEAGAAALGITERKDLEGGRLMMQLSKPKTLDPLTWWEDEERLKRLYAYCVNDVEVERAAAKRLLPLSPYEKQLWILDQQINDRGVAVDIEAVKNAIILVEKEKDRLNNEMREVTGNQVATCTAVQQIKDYLEFYGIGGESLDKASVLEHLDAEDLHPTAKKVLNLRQEAGKAATSKFKPMVESAGPDGRVRGCYQFSVAKTRRWGGRRIQLHNLQRQKMPFSAINAIIDDIRGGASVEELSLYYGNPLNFLGECTRSFLVAGTGNELLVADFSAIEARVLAWLAGEEKVLGVFRDERDIYKEAAAAIFGIAPENVTDSQRQVGKVAILALGYGGGVGAFQTMAKGYGVRMEPAFDYLWQVAVPDQRIRAEKTYALMKGRFPDISKKEFLASDLTKIFWRKANPNIVKYWADVESAAIAAVQNPGEKIVVQNIKFKKSGSFLWCQLPGGGVLCYPYPEVRMVQTPWDKEAGEPPSKKAVTYMVEDSTSRKFTREAGYGGLLAENLTQAVSRDIQADAMLRLDQHGFNIVLHTHDEIGCEMPIGEASLTSMISIMTKNPDWATGLPIAAKGFVDTRYHK